MCVLTIPPLSLERFLRALQNAPSPAMVLILPPVKLNSQRLSHCAFFSHHPWLTLSNVKRTNQCNANQFSRSQSPSARQENFQSVFHQRRGQRIKLESKRVENRSQVSAMGRASAPGKDTFVTGQRRLSQPVWVPCFLNHKHPQGRGPTPGLWSVSGPCPFLSAYSKQHTSLPHDPASADWLPCVTVVSTPKFDSETT